MALCKNAGVVVPKFKVEIVFGNETTNRTEKAGYHNSSEVDLHYTVSKIKTVYHKELAYPMDSVQSLTFLYRHQEESFLSCF